MTAALAAQTGLLHATEWDRRARNLGAVHGDHAELQRPAQAVDPARVTRMDIGDKAVFGCIRDRERLFFGIEGSNRRDRAEGFLTEDQRIRRNIGKNRGLIEQPPLHVPPATGQQSRAERQGICHVLLLLENRGFVHQGAEITVLIAGAEGDGHETIAAVSHGAAIRAWVGSRAVNADDEFIRQHLLENTGVVTLEGSVEGGWRLQTWQGLPVGGAELLDLEAADPTGESY